MNDASAAFEQLDGFFGEYSHALSKNLLTAVLGKSKEYIPINTGAMKRNTVMKEDAAGPYLVTETFYAEGQYYENLHHLRAGNKYMSISKSSVMALDNGDKALVNGLRGTAKFQEAYWTKYRKLMDAGMLTLSTPKWFDRAFDDIEKDGISGQSDQAVENARKAIREGQNYTVDI